MRHIAESAQAEYCSTFHFQSVRVQAWHLKLQCIFIGIYAIWIIRRPFKTSLQENWLIQTRPDHITKRPVCHSNFHTVLLHDHPDHLKHPSQTDQPGHSDHFDWLQYQEDKYRICISLNVLDSLSLWQCVFSIPLPCLLYLHVKGLSACCLGVRWAIWPFKNEYSFCVNILYFKQMNILNEIQIF